MKDKKGDVIGIGEELDMLLEKLKALQKSFNEERKKPYKSDKDIQLIQKYL